MTDSSSDMVPPELQAELAAWQQACAEAIILVEVMAAYEEQPDAAALGAGTKPPH
jgi:hypothetical protein